MSNSAKTLLDFLGRKKEERGFIATLARDSEITAPQLQKYFTGKNVPSLEVLDRIAEAMNKEAWELIRPPSKIPTDLLASIERLDDSKYDLLRPIIAALLEAQEELKLGKSNHLPRMKKE